MSDQEFNADQFVQDAIDGSMSTKIELVPVGEYVGRIVEVTNARKIEKEGKPPFASIDIMFEIDAPEVAQAIGRDQIKLRYNLLLDLDPATGRLDTRKGKNVRLGRLREIAGQNSPGAWSFGYLVGVGPLSVTVGHEEDRRDAELPPAERRVYDRITGVSSYT